MDDAKALLGDYSTFLTRILQKVEDEGFDLNDFVQIDHICFRTSSLENYAKKKDELQSIAKLLGETEVNGRPICTFRLQKPIVHDRWRIDAIELPAPKEGSNYRDRLEHIEFVLYDDIPTFLAKYSDKSFNLKSADRGINPEVALQLGEDQVKFHLLNLPTVVFIEQKLGITSVADNRS